VRILFLTQWFDPEPFFKGLAFARELVRREHHVEVLTGFPNYPGGEIYPGYRVKVCQHDTMEGIPVTRVPLYPSHDRSAIKRIANYSSFALSAATVGMLSVQRPDVAYVYHPPATIMFPAMVLRALRRVPFVLDIQDLWPETLAATGVLTNAGALLSVGGFCRLGYLLAARIAVLSPGFKKALTERGVRAEKIEVIYNWCDESALADVRSDAPILEEAALAGRFNVVFAGTMGRAQALSSVLRAARLVSDRCPRVQFVFVGGGVELAGLRAEAQEMRLPNVRFLPARPASEVGPLLKAADVLLVHLREDPLFAITIPSKTQAYLAAGRPIVMAVAGDAADLVRAAGAGVCVRSGEPDALAGAVCELAGRSRAELYEMGARGQAYYERYLSLAEGVSRFEELFREAAASVAVN
jgi:colanic acid biosynthesis glycosyl transferase WcaI